MIKPGVYRRAFDWRLSKTDKESSSHAAAAFVTLSSDEYADIFEDYLAISRKRKNNRTAMAKVQLHLIEELLIAQTAVKRYRERLDQLQPDAATSQVDDAKKREIDFLRREMFLHRAHANCIRLIGDGIAWRTLGYDRAALRALSGKAVKQQILEQGMLNELHEWSAIFDTGQGLALFNAVTNCLAIGDITVVKDDGSVEIVEVKSNDTDSSRISRQKQKMREVTELLKNGKGTLEGQDITIIRFDRTPRNDLPALFALLDEAGRSGITAQRIGNFSYVEAFDFRVLSHAEKEWETTWEQARKEMAPWIENEDFVMQMNSLEILSFTPNCAPFSVFPFPDRMCVDLLTGAKNYTCFLNLSELGREFERNGWQVEKWPHEFMKEVGGNDSSFFRLRKDGMHPEVPPADIMRILMETTRPSVIIETLEELFKLGPDGSSPLGFVVYSGEKDIWI